MRKAMKAVRIHKYGAAEELKYEEGPVPTPRSNDLLIKIKAAGVNPIDWKIREGFLKDFIHFSFPLILGFDFSGIVEECGKDVTKFKVGEEVFGRTDMDKPGTYAEYISVSEPFLVQKPKAIDHIHAAAVPLAALTAWQALFDTAALSDDQKVLIQGAAGGVGNFAVQLSKWKGAHIIGTASDANREFLLKLGVDEFIDYKKTRFEDVVSDVDVVFDTIGGEVQKRSWKVLKRGGILVSIVNPPSLAEAPFKDVIGEYVRSHMNAEELKEISQLIDSGKISAVVDNIFPLSEAAQAHKIIESRHTRGKIVLKIN